MLNRLLKCKKGSRCNLIHACEECGNNYQKRQFALHVKELNFNKLENFHYVVIGSKSITTLNENIEQIKAFMRDFSARKNRKRGIFKTAEFFSRIEVSFRAGLGFYPHVNIMFFNADLPDIQSELYHLCDGNDLKYRVFKKESSEDTIKSMLWYILKFNKMQWKKSVAAQVATKGMHEIRYSGEFKYTNLNKFDDEILPLIDMSFMKVHPIRSGREVAINNAYKRKQSELKQKKKKALSKLKSCGCGCGLKLDTRRKYYDRECMKKHRALKAL